MNYWPASSGLDMWTEWQPTELAEDVQRMKALGMNCARFFLFMPAFMAQPERVEPRMLEHLHYWLTLCEQQQLYTFPTFIVGHMSGEDWDVAWRQGANFISDQRVIAITKHYLESIIRDIRAYRYIAGYVLTNELPNYVGKQAATAIADWVETMVTTIKALDPERPVCVGDGAWAPEIIAEQTGFELRKLNRYQDYVGLHYYPREMSAWRHTFTTAYRLRLAREWGRPVIVEEFGTATTLCSEANQANYYRSVFYSALLNGAEGVLSWCLNDFDFEEKRPYTHHPFEERFGVVRTDRSLKPAAYEFGKFKSVVEELLAQGYQKLERPIGLFLPSYYYYRYPYQFQPEFDRWYDLYLETFGLLKRANLDVQIVVEPAQELENEGRYTHALRLTPAELPLLIVPRMKLMTKATRRALEGYLRAGGKLYFSFANDSWVLDWQPLAGVETDCKFGVPDFRPASTVNISLQRDFGDFKAGESWSIPLINDDPEASYCPVLGTTGEVWGVDQWGMPALIRHQVGQGQVLFAAYPLEMLALSTNDPQLAATMRRLYRALDQEYNRPGPIQICGDGLEVGVWQKEDAYRVIIFNHAWQATPGTLALNEQALTIKSTTMPLSRTAPGWYQFELPGKEAGQIIIDRERECNS